MNLLMWPMLAIVLLLCCLPVLIGVYVYRDAKSRGMNAVLWTLIALLAPTLIGLLIYLLVRGSYSNLRCALCAGLLLTRKRREQEHAMPLSHEPELQPAETNE